MRLCRRCDYGGKAPEPESMPLVVEARHHALLHAARDCYKAARRDPIPSVADTLLEMGDEYAARAAALSSEWAHV